MKMKRIINAISVVVVFSLFLSCNSSKGKKIIIEEFADYQCPFCRKAQDTLKALKKKYGERLEIRFRHFPLPYHLSAKSAAMAAECARDQGKFWEMHELLFNGSPNFGFEWYRDYARTLGLDLEKFMACYESSAKADIIERDLKEGEERGVSATPTFFINGVKLVGAADISEFKRIIKETTK
jgi:protein-disulfide isomerase